MNETTLRVIALTLAVASQEEGRFVENSERFTESAEEFFTFLNKPAQTQKISSEILPSNSATCLCPLRLLHLLQKPENEASSFRTQTETHSIHCPVFCSYQPFCPPCFKGVAGSKENQKSEG